MIEQLLEEHSRRVPKASWRGQQSPAQKLSLKMTRMEVGVGHRAEGFRVRTQRQCIGKNMVVDC